MPPPCQWTNIKKDNKKDKKKNEDSKMARRNAANLAIRILRYMCLKKKIVGFGYVDLKR